MRFFIVILMFLSLPAHAADAARYYRDEIKAGRAAHTADGFAEACQAGLTLGGYLESGDTAVGSLHAAIDDCRAALKLDPGHLNASLSYGIALSFEAKRTHRAPLARIAKEMFEKLVDEEPDNPLPHAALGDWHAHVSAAGLFARLALGGSRKRAREEFEASFALGAPTKPLMLEYIKFLARDGKADRAQALAAFDRYRALKPAPGPLNAILDERADALEAALKAGNKHAIKKAVAHATAFHGIKDWDNLKALSPEDVAY